MQQSPKFGDSVQIDNNTHYRTFLKSPKFGRFEPVTDIDYQNHKKIRFFDTQIFYI